MFNIFNKKKKTCDYCGNSLEENDAAICFHGIEDGKEYEIFVCEPCCNKISHEYDQIEDMNIAEKD